MQRMRALKTFQLGDERRTVKPGDLFETRHVKHYEARGMAELASLAKPEGNAAKNAPSGREKTPAPVTSESLGKSGAAAKPKTGGTEAG